MSGAAPPGGGAQTQSVDGLAAEALFEQFVEAQTLKQILGTFRGLCEVARVRPAPFPAFYPRLRAQLRSWKAQALWAKFDKRAAQRCYARGRAAQGTRVLVVGAGPCGLRAAVEAQLLGAKVVVVEKRERVTRHNVLHLWPFVIHDLRALGAKKFYPKFCVGAIDHVSIRQLQCVLLKVALLLGVELHENVTFVDLVEPEGPPPARGWTARVAPADHPVATYEFDLVVGADGKRNTLKSFKRKEFRGKLAIAVTANFLNRRTEPEARVSEISGVVSIFRPAFFSELRTRTGIDLENIVYYKDETHYFVMTARKSSLLARGVILEDRADTQRLLALDNVSRAALLEYARDAADYATAYQLPQLDFAVNHFGHEDVAMFDFTSMYAAESACRVVERRGHRLLQALVGDSLLEPFWPTGSGCARGFLSSLDACWMLRSWALGTMTPLQVLAERESVYRLLAQTTPENLSKDYAEYTLNPASRYPNLNASAVRPAQVRSLVDSDAAELRLDEPLELPRKRRRKDLNDAEMLLGWMRRQVAPLAVEDFLALRDGSVLAALVCRFRPDLVPPDALSGDDWERNNQLVFDALEREYGIRPSVSAHELSQDGSGGAAIVTYLAQLYERFRGEVPHVASERPSAVVATSPPPPEARRGFVTAASSQRSSVLRLQQQQQQRHPVADADEEFLKRIKKRRSLERDRALFILNKDANRQASQSSSKCRKSVLMLAEDRENFSTRVKHLEEKLYGVNASSSGGGASNRVVGRLDHSDWNVRMLEEKMRGETASSESTRQQVPKWNREMFEDKLKALDAKSKAEFDVAGKYVDFDARLRVLEQKLREGSALDVGERGRNKVSELAHVLSRTPEAHKALDAPVEAQQQRHVASTPKADEADSFRASDGTTPERAEFENTTLEVNEADAASEIDEDEWTDQNFGASANDATDEDESDFSSDDGELLPDEEAWQIDAAWHRPSRCRFRRRDNDRLASTALDSASSDASSDDAELSYEEYENEDGSTATEEEAEEEESGARTNVLPKRNGGADYAVLDGDTGSATETSGYTETESVHDDERGVEGDEDSSGSEPLSASHRSIPTIVIDETTAAPPDEDDESYFDALKRQNEAAERQLEDLIQEEPLGALPSVRDAPGQEIEDVVTAPSRSEAETSSPLLPVAEESLLSESSSSKMMLRLKERYLLGGSATTANEAVVGDPAEPIRMEPLVRSFLELISEKQKMLASPPSAAAAQTELCASPELFGSPAAAEAVAAVAPVPDVSADVPDDDSLLGSVLCSSGASSEADVRACVDESVFADGVGRDPLPTVPVAGDVVAATSSAADYSEIPFADDESLRVSLPPPDAPERSETLPPEAPCNAAPCSGKSTPEKRNGSLSNGSSFVTLRPRKKSLDSAAFSCGIKMDRDELLAKMAAMSHRHVTIDSLVLNGVEHGGAATQPEAGDQPESGDTVEELRHALRQVSLRFSRQQALKRCRSAAELFERLTALAERHCQHAERVAAVERSLRGDGSNEAALLEEWFRLERSGSSLEQHEAEALARAKELELEDRFYALQRHLEDGDSEPPCLILAQMLEVAEQRDHVIKMLDASRQRHNDIALAEAEDVEEAEAVEKPSFLA